MGPTLKLHSDIAKRLGDMLTTLSPAERARLLLYSEVAGFPSEARRKVQYVDVVHDVVQVRYLGVIKLVGEQEERRFELVPENLTAILSMIFGVSPDPKRRF